MAVLRLVAWILGLVVAIAMLPIFWALFQILFHYTSLFAALLMSFVGDPSTSGVPRYPVPSDPRPPTPVVVQQRKLDCPCVEIKGPLFATVQYTEVYYNGRIGNTSGTITLSQDTGERGVGSSGIIELRYSGVERLIIRGVERWATVPAHRISDPLQTNPETSIIRLQPNEIRKVR